MKKEIILSYDKTGIWLGISRIILFSLLTAVGSHIYIPLPFTPVPITLQNFFVLLSGAILGAGAGTISQLSYIGLGVSGLPVFSQGYSGVSRLIGPTGGYIFGFVFSAYIVGKLLSVKNVCKSYLKTFFVFMLGMIVILICGAIQLSIVMHYSIKQTMVCGILPFIYGDFIKLIILVNIYRLYINRRDLSSVGRAVGS